MKILGTFVLVLFLSCQFALAQDTLYVYRAGIVVTKRATSEIDSITFNRNYTAPVSGTVTDIDGNVYHSVTIGTQTWMVENLKATKYRNGDIIGTTGSVYTDLTYAVSPKYQWAFNGVESNVAVYGRLYTWYAVTDSRNIAPQGWHVASDAEWAILQSYLIANGFNYDKTTTGNKIAKSLCSTSLWNTSGVIGSPGYDLTQNNSSGFSSVPTGYRGIDGYYYIPGGGDDIWTSTENSSTLACARGCGYNCVDLGANNLNKNYGFSVRCIKDVVTVPVLSTAIPASITDSTATCGGNITYDGLSTITARGVCWSTRPNPTTANSKTSDGTGTGTFTSSIKGLKVDSTYYVRAYATNTAGTAYGNQVSFIAQITMKDMDGNVYHTVKIGTQTWMVENLKTMRFNDGTLIPLVTDNNSWINLATPGYCFYANDSTTYKKTYGALYNWYAVNTGKLAPTGWHIPSQTDINTLATYLGGYSVAASKLKESGNTHWYSANGDATNSSGFTALPGGYRSCASGDSHNAGLWCPLWASNDLQVRGGRYMMVSDQPGLNYDSDGKSSGFSVRCIKDTVVLPNLTTNPVFNITDSTATGGGSITADGGKTITARGVCWSTKPNPTTANSKTTDGTGTGTFTSSIKGLKVDSTYYVRAYAMNSLGTAYGSQVSFIAQNTITDIDGNMYHTVKIGTQTWMVENLKTIRFNDGAAIPLVTDNFSWANLVTPGYCFYANDTLYKNPYGTLYNWYAVNTGKLAPAGWHVATDAEWTKLTTYFGGEDAAGGKMKETGFNHWLTPNTGATNEKWFTGLPGGLRSYSDGTFRNNGTNGYFWSSTQSDSLRAWDRELFNNQGNCFRYNYDSKHYGFSVRCVKDTLVNLSKISASVVSSITTSSTGNKGKAINSTIANNKTSDVSGVGMFPGAFTELEVKWNLVD